jgi:prophage DNA circulation protein
VTWREDLRKVRLSDGRKLVGASFRGVPFLVDVSERGGGRRVVTHEFPLRDDPFVEDLGRRARTFRVDGYVLGDDYLADRDALLAALEDESGPGELVHPYHGVRRAICVTVSVHEARGDGGIATLAIEFAETPAQAPVPTVVTDSTDQVGLSADSADAATDTEFANKYSPSNLPSHALASAESAIKKAAAGLKDKLGPVISATQEAAQLTGQVALLTAEASSLVRTPASILGQFRGAMNGLVDTMLAAPGAVMDAFTAAYSVDLGPIVVATTSTRARELTNQAALTSALRRVFAIAAVRLAPVVPYESIDAAIAARDRLTAILDEQAAAAGDDAYPAIMDLRSQMLAAVPGGKVFASILNVTRRVAVPSLLLAYQLYGSVDLEADIVVRNAIRNPGFVVGDLKVISDG